MSLGHKTKRADAAQTNKASSVNSNNTKYPRFGKRGAPQAFPSKLYEILEGENPEIVGWTPTGRGFEVRDHARLSSEVLGRFFKQDKFSSFQRQLNLYGFRKITKGTEAGSYQHPHFRRGERTTLLTIRRSTKASPARVPSSPASRVQPEAPGTADKPRHATPSPPPEPEARGVLPWPRQAAAPLPSLPPEVRDARGPGPNDTSVAGGGGVATTVNGHSIGVETRGDRHEKWEQRQQAISTKGGAAGAWAAPAGGGGGYAKANGNHDGSGGGWATADQVVARGEADNRGWNSGNNWGGMTERLAAGDGPCAMHVEEDAESKEKGSIERERQKAEGLDRADVEVVGLLQRMAKEAQDSPSRTREQAAGRTSEQPAATRWEEPSPTSAPRPQPFRMPRPLTVPEVHRQGEQPAGTERLYEMLNRERESVVTRGPFPYTPSDGRSGFPHPPHARLPAPFPTMSPEAPRMEAFNPMRPGMDAIGNDRFPRHLPSNAAVDASARECSEHNCRPFESHVGNSRPSGGEDNYRVVPSSTPSSFPPYGIERLCRNPHDTSVDRILTDMGVHRAAWHGPGGPLVAPFGKYHGDGAGNEGQAFGVMPKAEMAWSQSPSCEGGRRIVQ